jgi:ketosteroid isomerase-like protein
MSQGLEPVESQVKALSEGWVAAELRGDTAFLAGVLADDFVGIGPRGFMLTKDEWIQRHQSGALRYAALTLDDVRVRAYGEAAVLVGREAQTATYQGQAVPGEFRTTQIWVRQQGSWRLAGVQYSPIMPLPAAPPAR